MLRKENFTPRASGTLTCNHQPDSRKFPLFLILAFYTTDCVKYHTIQERPKARCPIATNLDIDEKLLDAAVSAWNFKTKREAVNAGLTELINKKKRLGLLELAGTIDYDPQYNYKDHRSRKKSRKLKGGK